MNVSNWPKALLDDKTWWFKDMDSWIMVTIHYLSLQENPYLFTYRNSNYLPRMLKPQVKTEVRRSVLWLTNMQMNQGQPPDESSEASKGFFMSWTPGGRLERMKEWCLKQGCPLAPSLEWSWQPASHGFTGYAGGSVLPAPCLFWREARIFVCDCAQSCPTLRDPMDHRPPGCSVHGIS